MRAVLPTGGTRKQWTWRSYPVRATELIEKLESVVNEFGDKDVVQPDPLEDWWYPVEDVELDLSNDRIKLCPNV